MAIAVKNSVTANLLNSLNEIRISGGHENDAAADGQRVRGNSPDDRDILLIDNGDTFVDDSPVNADDYNASYTVKCFVAVSDVDASQPYPPELVQLVAEVRQRLNEDYTRGAFAINTITGADSPMATDERAGYAGRSLDVTVHYRTAKNDPTSL